MGICMGAFAKRPYKHNSKKVIDYQFMMQKRFLDFSDSAYIT